MMLFRRKRKLDERYADFVVVLKKDDSGWFWRIMEADAPGIYRSQGLRRFRFKYQVKRYIDRVAPYIRREWE